jgi:hypothetical protein
MRHEVLVYQRDLQRWKSRCQPVLAVDLHAPAACEMDGIYTYLPATEGSGEPHLAALRWATCFSESLGPELASSSFSRMITYRSRWETPTFTAHCLAQGPPPALTFEIPYAMVRQTLLTRERYRDAGRRMGEAIVKGIRTL